MFGFHVFFSPCGSSVFQFFLSINGINIIMMFLRFNSNTYIMMSFNCFSFYFVMCSKRCHSSTKLMQKLLQSLLVLISKKNPQINCHIYRTTENSCKIHSLINLKSFLTIFIPFYLIARNKLKSVIVQVFIDFVTFTLSNVVVYIDMCNRHWVYLCGCRIVKMGIF